MLSHLDIRTPRGQANERHTERCWAAIMQHFAFMDVKRQYLHDAHPADGILRSRATNKPLMLIEVKSRHDFDERTFWERHRGTWLISNHKLRDNIPIARAMRIPFYGAMHIVQSRTVLFKKIWGDGVTCAHEVRRCSTQATINGGTKIRDNAFIPMDDALRITYV